MTQAQQILDYLWSIAPHGATNAQIAHGTGIASHQGVYMTNQHLLHEGRVRSERQGRTWVFYAVEGPAVDLGHPSSAATSAAGYRSQAFSAAGFEQLARKKLEQRYDTSLLPGSLPNVPKRFDFVSPDRRIVGDAKYYTLVGGVGLPPAKFSIIAEHVWLLERTGVPVPFLVFGNDPGVPAQWLKRYGHLSPTVAFYFLSDSGQLEDLR
ncbi:MAG: hypothetical protein HY669_00235 [Chloroflexi bacterium]|nr:hypothetical protein [Chloroflexota bacterium]